MVDLGQKRQTYRLSFFIRTRVVLWQREYYRNTKLPCCTRYGFYSPSPKVDSQSSNPFPGQQEHNDLLILDFFVSLALNLSKGLGDEREKRQTNIFL